MPPKDYYKSKSFKSTKPTSKPKPDKPKKVTIGYGEGQVDPGLAAAVLEQSKTFYPKITDPLERKRIADRRAKQEFTGGFDVKYPDPIKPIIPKDEEDKEDISTQIMNRIMRKGDHISDPFSKTKKTWETAGMVPLGQHKLRTQYDRLLAKYGEGWGETTQAKERLAYLAGVPTERGGFLGGRDPEYGGGKWGVDEFGNPIDPESDKFKEAEKYRQEVLRDMSVIPSSWEEPLVPDILAKLDIEKLRFGLSPEQYFNFKQQLMAADPSYGNLAYKEARPWSSGKGITDVGKFFMSPATGILGSLAGKKETEQRPEYTGEALDPALLRALKERGEILDPFARDESTQELAYGNYGWGGGGGEPPPGDTDPDPGTGNQWATADPGQIGYYNPETGQYEYGTYEDYSPFAQVRDGGIIGLDGGGYINDYQAADSLMFKDPQEDEEWEYNV